MHTYFFCKATDAMACLSFDMQVIDNSTMIQIKSVLSVSSVMNS